MADDNLSLDDVVDVEEISDENEDRDKWAILTEEAPAGLMTTVWLADLSFPVKVKKDDGEEVDSFAKGMFATTSRDKLIARIATCISVPESGFDVSEYTTKTQAVKEFFDGSDDRNIFIGLVPVE